MKYIISIALIICLFDMPYGYYQLVRLLTAAYFSFELLRNPNSQYRALLIILIILFQPLIKISLGRTLWNLVDIIVAFWLLFLYTPSQQED